MRRSLAVHCNALSGGCSNGAAGRKAWNVNLDTIGRQRIQSLQRMNSKPFDLQRLNRFLIVEAQPQSTQAKNPAELKK